MQRRFDDESADSLRWHLTEYLCALDVDATGIDLVPMACSPNPAGHGLADTLVASFFDWTYGYSSSLRDRGFPGAAARSVQTPRVQKLKRAFAVGVRLTTLGDGSGARSVLGFQIGPVLRGSGLFGFGLSAMSESVDEVRMGAAIEAAAFVRRSASPNPWVGAVVVSAAGVIVGVGGTEPAGGAHAEVVALRAAGGSARGGSLFVTLEPCAHHGRTGPCVDAVIAAGLVRVVVGVLDPDHRVAGRGVSVLRRAGIEVEVGVGAAEVERQLEPYLVQRRTGRPLVVAKLAITLDGGIAAADGSSRWITGAEARADAHVLRAESDAIVVGAGTVRTDDPALTVRGVDGRDPLRVVLGRVAPTARVHPCVEWIGTLPALLDDLGERGVLQVMVEGGSRTVRSFLDLELIDRLVLYVAPALITGTDMVPMIAGPSAVTIGDIWRGRFEGVRQLGADIRIDLRPQARTALD